LANNQDALNVQVTFLESFQSQFTDLEVATKRKEEQINKKYDKELFAM